jgi:hypothetical protein
MITKRIKRTRIIPIDEKPPTGPQPAAYAIIVHPLQGEINSGLAGEA